MTNPLTGPKIAYGYNAASQLTSVGYGAAGDSEALAYDGLGRVTSDAVKTSGATVASAAYGFDSAGNLTSQSTDGSRTGVARGADRIIRMSSTPSDTSCLGLCANYNFRD